MADNTIPSALFALAILCFVGTEAGSYCTYYGGGFYTYHKYCSFGCCGNTFDQDCCSSNVGLIVGGVIAGIAVLCIIVALVCCCVKKQGHAGRVVGPHPQRGPGANVTVVHAGASGQAYGMQPMGAQPYGMQPMGAQPQYGMQPMGAQPQYGMQPVGAQPPTYKNANIPPPAYTYSDPAYPPGAVVPPPAASDQNQPSAPPPSFSTGQSSGSAPQGTNMPQ